MNTIKVKKLTSDAVIPFYSRQGDAAFDLVSNEFHFIQPQAVSAVGTGLAFQIPEGYEVEVVPRSGISLKTPLRVANAPGTVDENYRGEIKVIMHNSLQQLHNYATKEDNQVRIDVMTDRVMTVDGTEMTLAEIKESIGLEVETGIVPYPTYFIRKGDRIAQGKLRPVVIATFETVDELNETNRGDGGFGSSGNTVK